MNHVIRLPEGPDLYTFDSISVSNILLRFPESVYLDVKRRFPNRVSGTRSGSYHYIHVSFMHHFMTRYHTCTNYIYIYIYVCIGNWQTRIEIKMLSGECFIHKEGNHWGATHNRNQDRDREIEMEMWDCNTDWDAFIPCYNRLRLTQVKRLIGAVVSIKLYTRPKQ